MTQIRMTLRYRNRALNFEWIFFFFLSFSWKHTLVRDSKCSKTSTEVFGFYKDLVRRERERDVLPILPQFELVPSFMWGRFMWLLSDLHALEVELWIHCFCTRHTTCKTFLGLLPHSPLPCMKVFNQNLFLCHNISTWCPVRSSHPTGPSLEYGFYQFHAQFLACFFKKKTKKKNPSS